MSFSELKGFSDLSENLLDDQLRANIISFLDWGFICKGNFNNVRIPTSGLYGGNEEVLKPVKDPRFTQGQVWQAYRNNWVWQSGLPSATQPIPISGVYINSTFYPSNTSGAYAHYVDYPRGRIVFNTAISTSATVKVEYSHKMVNIVDADETPFIREIQNGSFRLDSAAFQSLASGDYAILPDSKIQTPLVAVEVTSDTRFSPYALGGGQYTRTKVLCHIMADDARLAKKIATAIAIQNEKAINTFDVNEVSSNNKAPLTYKGSIAPGALNHPDMVTTYEWKKLCITNVNSQEGTWLDSVYYIPVSFTAEVILNNI